LLVNLGSPDNPSFLAVAKYLKYFLNEGRVIDLHPVLRFFLVHFIIIPFRTFKAVNMYRKIWEPDGSPLLKYSNDLKNKLEKELPADTDVYLAMRYGNPGLKKCLKELEMKKYGYIKIVPLFPQYASSTSGSIIDKTLKLISRWNFIPDIHVISSFFDKSPYIQSMATLLSRSVNKSSHQHIVFSFHSIPLNHVARSHQDRDCPENDCQHELNNDNVTCYKATCYATARMISQAAGIKENDFTVTFQSRFGRKWLGPFTKDVIKTLPGNGIRNIVVISPSFVTDCLETIIELGQDYRDLFIANGGKSYVLVESLNDNDEWVKGLADITGS